MCLALFIHLGQREIVGVRGDPAPGLFGVVSTRMHAGLEMGIKAIIVFRFVRVFSSNFDISFLLCGGKRV